MTSIFGRGRRRHIEAWTAAAAQVGGAFVPRGGSFWRQTPAMVIAVLDHGIEVIVDHYTVSTGKTSITYTRIAAQAPGALGLEIKVLKEGVLARIGKALGLKDLELGDAVFDARYLVRGNDDELARAWLDERVRAALLAAGSDYGVVLEADEVKAQRVGLELEPARLVAAMRAVVALAAGGRELVVRWRRLAAELGGRYGGADEAYVAGRARIDLEHEGHAIAVETTTDAGLGTRVRRVLGRRNAPRFEVAPGAALASVANAPFALTGSVEDAWQAIQPARLACDGEAVSVSWSGYVPDAARVRHALTLLEAVRPAGVPFR